MLPYSLGHQGFQIMGVYRFLYTHWENRNACDFALMALVLRALEMEGVKCFPWDQNGILAVRRR